MRSGFAITDRLAMGRCRGNSAVATARSDEKTGAFYSGQRERLVLVMVCKQYAIHLDKIENN